MMPNEFKMELSDVAIKEDANQRDNRLELRLKIKDLEVLKKAFDVCFKSFILKILLTPSIYS